MYITDEGSARHLQRESLSTWERLRMVSKDSKMVTPEMANPYLKPPSISTSQSLKNFIYNRETGAFLGRTASSWVSNN
ncbi:hypothetical protein WN51_01707 [Melipona quadrifasciata]|uniref:Uncharacterized protein n=1 Tax=Melipona quadrifasciata TaxID=166423 RepID=A0A0M8ZX70_9HYME|nr:hypothetical protein WN51_01707 [Melipona quadrifasciata]